LRRQNNAAIQQQLRRLEQEPEQSSELSRLITELESFIPAPVQGLPEPVFLLLSRITPLVSVDLLIADELGRTLLTWRDDKSYGPGWHLPGGIVRYGEKAAHRVHEVARLELGARVNFEPSPLSLQEILKPNAKERGHIISMLYRCRLLNAPDASLRFEQGSPKPGRWLWHDKCPDNLIEEQRSYERYFRRGT